MKKIIALTMTVFMLATLLSVFTFSASAAEKTTEWICWVQDGNEITQGKVTTNSKGIVESMSSNWNIQQQDKQTKITDTYWSPATVWTTNASLDFELVWEVGSKAFVEIGFLHCIGGTGSGVSIPCLADGSDLNSVCTISWSADGKTWNDIDYDILEGDNVLVSGMTGYNAEDIKPYNGNVAAGDDADEYTEKYFVISGFCGEGAKYVKYWFKGNGRSNYWDPCVRDARFTVAVEDEIDKSDIIDVTSEPTEVDTTPVNVLKDIQYTVFLEGSYRDDYTADTPDGGYSDGLSDTQMRYRLTDGSIEVKDGGASGTIGAYSATRVEFTFDLGKKVENLTKFTLDQFSGAWGVSDGEYVEYFISEDGTNFTSVGKVNFADAVKTDASGWTKADYVLELDTGVSAKYIKAVAQVGNNYWGSEIQAFATPKSGDNPSTDTSDNGIVALLVIASLSAAAAVIVKKSR